MWIKLDDQIAHHPKFLTAGPIAAWLWICGQSYCARYLTDGAIPVSALPALASTIPHPGKYADTLVAVGLWERTPGGFHVHDYEVYQPTGETVEQRRVVRREAGRRGGLRSGEVRGSKPPSKQEANVKQTGSNLLHPNEANASSKPEANANPVPVPVPCTSKNEVQREAPLGLRPLINVAWPGRPPVPGTLHAEFRAQLAGDEEANDTRLRAWYPTVAEVWKDRDIGDDKFQFWRARFREWIGTTVTPGVDKQAARKAMDAAFLNRARGA
jgi:hypothetical protein